jgi:small subunit ribosomal protein S16
MAVRMRLMRMGKTKQPVYRVVVIDQRAPRDGRYIEQIGRYDARQEPSLVEIDNERAADWLAKGAQPSETVEKLLNISGALNTMKIKTGGIHVVGVERDEAPKDLPASDTTDAAETSPTSDSETDVPEAGGGSEGDEPTEIPGSETDETTATSDSETDVPAAGGGSEGGRPPSDKTEEE